MLRNHPFNQRNNVTKRAVGVEVGCKSGALGKVLESVEGNIGGSS